MPKCRGQNKSGKPCGFNVPHGVNYCKHHDPANVRNQRTKDNNKGESQEICSKKNDTETLKILYEENSQFFRALTEFRFKVVNRYILTITSLVLLEGWIIKNKQVWSEYIPVPLYLIALATIFFYRIEERNANAMNVMIKVGSSLEEALSESHHGLYVSIKEIQSASNFYTLKYAYLAIAAVSLLLAIVATLIYYHGYLQ